MVACLGATWIGGSGDGTAGEVLDKKLAFAVVRVEMGRTCDIGEVVHLVLAPSDTAVVS
jgi:hypothetical protein